MVAFTIFGVASAIGGVLALLLPETLGAPLPDSFDDLEVGLSKTKQKFKLVLLILFAKIANMPEKF